VGEPEALNTQAHSEQPKPRKRSLSIHTSLRSIRILGSVCDTSHSPRENFLGEETGRGGTNSTLIVQLCCQRKSAGISGLDENPVRTHRSSYTHAMYFVTLLLS
jgi:hypothetical protein